MKPIVHMTEEELEEHLESMNNEFNEKWQLAQFHIAHCVLGDDNNDIGFVERTIEDLEGKLALAFKDGYLESWTEHLYYWGGYEQDNAEDAFEAEVAATLVHLRKLIEVQKEWGAAHNLVWIEKPVEMNEVQWDYFLWRLNGNE